MDQSGASAQADAAGGRAQLPGGAQPAQDRTHYKVVDSYFAGNKKLAGTGTGARVEFADIDPSFLEMSGTRGGRRTCCARARLDHAQLSASRRRIRRREGRRGFVHETSDLGPPH